MLVRVSNVKNSDAAYQSCSMRLNAYKAELVSYERNKPNHGPLKLLTVR